MLKRLTRPGARAFILAACASMLLAATALPAAAEAVDKTRSEKFLQDARDYLKKRDANAAVIQLKNALKSDPGNVAARKLLAEIYLLMGQGAYAEKELKAAEQRGATSDDVLVDLGRALLLQGKYDDVLKEMAIEKATDSNRTDVLIVRGQAELGLHHTDLAEKAFSEAHQAKPEDARPLVGLAQSLASRGKILEGEAQVDAALKLNPDLVEALILKAEMRRLARDLPGALALFDKAIAQRPSNVAAQLGRAATLIDLNRDAEAEPNIKAALAIAPKHPMARYLQALSLAKKKDYVGAQDMLQDAGSALDDHLPSMFLKGAVAYALGQYEQSITNLTLYLDRIPANTTATLRARKLLAATYVRTKQPAKVIEVLAPIKDQPQDAQILSLLANAYMQQGQINKGTEYFEKAAEAAPDVASIRTQLALSRLAQGQSDQAEGDLEVAVDMDKDATQAGVLLSLVRLRKGEYDQAIQSAEALAKSMPNSPLPANLLGAAYLGKNDVAKAREMFNAAIKQKPDFNPARLNMAQIDLREGKTDQAKAQYNAVIQNDARNISAFMGLANIAAREKNTDQMVATLNRAVDADPRASAPRMALIAYYNNAGNRPKALAVARDYNDKVPNTPEVLDVLGREEATAGNPGNAVEVFRRLTDLAPKSGRAYSLLASAQVLNDDVTGARQSLQTALKVEEGYTPALVSLIELETREKRYDEALRLSDTLKDKQPKASAGDMLRGDIMMAQQKYAEAVTAYEAGMTRENSALLAVRRYNAQRAAKQDQVAKAMLEKWLASNDNPAARQVLASGYINDKNYPKAIEQSEKIIATEKDNPIVLNNLAWLYQQTGDQRAKDFAERAYQIAPKSAAVMDTLGWILVQGADPKRGIELLQKAVETAPTQGDIRYHMAAGLQRSGRTDDARKELEALLAGGDKVENFSTKTDAEALLRQLKGGG